MAKRVKIPEPNVMDRDRFEDLYVRFMMFCEVNFFLVKKNRACRMMWLMRIYSKCLCSIWMRVDQEDT